MRWRGIGGLQTQYAPSGYVGLWTRVAGFERGALTAALEERSLVQATLMRTTIHVVSRREYWRYAMGVRQARRAWALRLPGAEAGEAELIANAERIRAALADGPRTVKELGELGAGFVGSLGCGWISFACHRRDMGTAPRRPARPRRGLGRTMRRHGRGRRGTSRARLSACLRPGAVARHRVVGGDPGHRCPTGR